MKKYKISVALISYNGVEYIGEQLLSILNQTVKPDEIIISDDGSTDGTIDLIHSIRKRYNNSGIRIIVLTDNPIHGISSNMNWALSHVNGDIVFIAGQDDVWERNKIQSIVRVYENNKDAQIVITNAKMIDAKGNLYQGVFCESFISSLGVDEGALIKVDRRKYMESVESDALVSGPVLSLKKSLLELVVPIPPSILEDQWMEFLGLAEDSLYFLNEKTTSYRIHNSSTHSKNITILQWTKKNFCRIKKAYRIPFYAYNLGRAMKSYYDQHPADFEGRSNALSTVFHIIKIGETEIECMSKGRLKGSLGIIRLFKSDIRYRKTGTQQFFVSLLYIILYSKKKRSIDIDNEKKRYNR